MTTDPRLKALCARQRDEFNADAPVHVREKTFKEIQKVQELIKSENH